MIPSLESLEFATLKLEHAALGIHSDAGPYEYGCCAALIPFHVLDRDAQNIGSIGVTGRDLNFRLQNIDFARLTRKILQNMDLAYRIRPPQQPVVEEATLRGFLDRTLKILISKNLDGTDPVLSPQNIERL